VCNSLDFRDKRTRTSVHIAVQGRSFVIDTGADFRAQMLREDIQSLDAVVFTHYHKDHIAGLDDVRPYYFRNGQVDLPIYADFRTAARIKEEFYYAFQAVKYPGVPGFDLHEITLEPFQIQGVEFLPIEVMHYKLPVMGFRLGDFTYITDANFISEKEKSKIKGTKILVLNALQLEWHISHFTLSQALSLVEELKPQRAYLTHISHNLGSQQGVEKNLPPNVKLAYDGLKIKV
jgi:phosphoribosyl 1,2-cyclic phosphate phosphodiesterase